MVENTQSQSVPVVAKFSGISTCSIHTGCSCTCLTSIQNSDTWILDSGASDHMTSNKSLLSNIISLPISYLITLPNGYKVKISFYGSVILNSTVTLSKVIYVLTFKFNLISIHKLLVGISLILILTNNSCYLQSPSLKRSLELGKVTTGLYLFNSKTVQAKDPQSIHHVVPIPYASTNNVTSTKSHVLWHNGLGHLPFSKL